MWLLKNENWGIYDFISGEYIWIKDFSDPYWAKARRREAEILRQKWFLPKKVPLEQRTGLWTLLDLSLLKKKKVDLILS